MNLEQKIEAILFFKGEPVSRKRLSEFLGVGQNEINESIEKLKSSLESRGIVLQEKDNEITLGTAPEFSGLIENLQKEELNKELSKAAFETLSIILYKNGASRAEIDYVRGVNSSFTLRALSVRGLIEKVLDPNDNRKYLYKPSLETLSFMGLKSIDELPEYKDINTAIQIVVDNTEQDY